MRPVAFGLLATLPFVVALRMPLRRVTLPRQATVDADDDDVELMDTLNVVYMANITVGGTEYPVQLDTGSSDLWVRPPGNGLSNTQPTSLTYNISYSIGYAAGNIVTVPVEFAGFTVNSQAVLDVTSSNNPIFQFGAAGILGLGFSSLSNIDIAVSGAGGTYGKPFLYNAFAQNTSQPNYLAFTLGRTNGLPTDVESSLAIGELEPSYSGIMQTQPISTYPVQEPARWSVLMDGYEFADGVKRTLNTTMAGASSAVLLLDTGASYAYAPQAITDGLYSGIQGASFDSAAGMWNVPCSQEINFAIWIAGRKFDWHPLDVVVPSVNNNKTCLGSIQPAASLDGFDFHAGDVFLRSLYTMLDFGDYDSTGALGDPYVRLWSLIDQPAASAEFHKIRGGTAQPYKSSSTVAVNAASPDANTPTGAGTVNAVTADQELYKNVNTLVSYAPIALGVLGLNAVLLLAILGGGIWYICCRRKGKKNGRIVTATSTLGVPTSLSRSHSYQKVKNEDVETPLNKLSFNEGPSGTARSGKESHTSSYYAAVDGPDDGEMTAVNDSFRMSTFKDTAQGRASHMPSPSKSGLVGSRSPSPSGQNDVSPAASPSAAPSQLPSSDPSSADGAPPQSRTQEYLAAMEARKTALAGADARRNTYHEEAEEPLQAPARRFGVGAGPDGRRAMSSYVGDAEPEPLQVPQRRAAAAQPQALQAPQEISMPPGPSRTPEYLQALEARRAALQSGAEDQSRRTTYHDPEPLQPPTRRFQGGDGRRTTYMDGSSGEPERGTIYFDAPEGPQQPPSPGHARGSVYSAMQQDVVTPPQASHTRTGSNASGRSPVSSPNRANFNPTPPRGPSNLNPGTRPAGSPAAHGRSGSYAGSGLAPRGPPPVPQPRGWSRGHTGLSEETDLTEQRPSFDERAEVGADEFADSAAAPSRPFAAAPSYRYSSAH